MRPAVDWPTAGAEPSLSESWRGVAGLAAWFAGLGVAIWLLQLAGRGVLAPPPLTSLAGAGRWAGERDAVTVGFAVVRLLAVGLAWYLVVVTVVGLALRAVRAGRLVRWTDAATVPGVRRLLSGAMGVGVTATSAALAAVPLPAGPLTAAPPVTEPAPPDDGAPPAVMTRLPDGTATMRRLPDQPTATTTSAPPGPAPGAGPAEEAPAPATSAPAGPGPASPAEPDEPAAEPDEPAAEPDGTDAADPVGPGPAAGDDRPGADATWVIEAGDHLWAVAEETLADAWGRAPRDREVADYWRAVVDANRDRLADPGNPDLVFPGQVILLPPPPAAG